MSLSRNWIVPAGSSGPRIWAARTTTGVTLSKWTGKGTTEKYPPPSNLRLSAQDLYYKRFDWDYDPKYKDFIDGFIVYRQYTCPGEDSLLKWPESRQKNRQTLRREVENRGQSRAALLDKTGF